MEESTPSPEMAMGLEPADGDDTGSWKTYSTKNNSKYNDLDEKELKELYQTTTAPEFLQWREQVHKKLSLLEQKMDPLAARHQYNLENSLIYSVPEEILVMTMRCLNDEDPAALFCLRQVSRR